MDRLTMEIAAGKIPDLFYTAILPINRYAGKGILEDLWPYIEKDAELGGRGGLFCRGPKSGRYGEPDSKQGAAVHRREQVGHALPTLLKIFLIENVTGTIKE